MLEFEGDKTELRNIFSILIFKELYLFGNYF